MQNSMYYTTSGLTSLPAYQGGGYLDQYGRQQYGLGKLVKKITKPIASVLDKIIPNEIKPALPYLAAAVPFMLPAGFTMGGLGSALSRGLVSAAASAASQLSQEGAEKRGLNPFTTALSGISGYLSTPSAGMDLGSMKTAYVPESVMQGIDSASQVGIAGSPNITNAPLTIGEKAMNLGLNVGQTASDYLSKGTTAFEKMTGPGDITGKDLMTFGKAIAPGEVLAGTEQAYNVAQDALDKYNSEQNALGQMGVADQSKRRAAVAHAMQLSEPGISEDRLNDIYQRLGLADGGVGYQYGGGAVGYREGGLMSLGGHEMDFRAAGGFVPIGKKERADDVPARLSKNEFVFTAKAVRNAGGGDIKQGAKKMYQIMKQLEARA
jgi:hypothetical protein